MRVTSGLLGSQRFLYLFIYFYLLLILCRPPLGSIKHRYMQENKMYNILGYIAGLIQCFVVSKYVSPTAHFSIQWCIPIGKWLSQVGKNIKLATYKGK